MNRLRALVPIVAIILAACNAGTAPTTAPATASQAAGSPIPQATAGPTVRPPVTGSNGPDLLVVRRDGGKPDRGYAVIDGGSMTELASLPLGVPSADWRTIYAATSNGGTTQVAAVDPNDGSTIRTITVPGAWTLPTIGYSKMPAGLAGDGGVLVLVEPAAAAAAPARATRFAIVATDGSTAPRVISLPGTLEFDAISPSGTTLFVLQHSDAAGPTHYAVRAIDLASGKLIDGDIVDKRNAGEAMGGYAVVQIAGRSGFIYTVYRGANGPFIHALDTADSIAFCIDLPGPKDEDVASAAAWSLSLDPAGGTVYATNGVLGTVADVDLASFSVTRTANLARIGVVTLAKFGGGPALYGGQAALATGGAALYVIGDRGIRVVRTSDLVTMGHVASDRTFTSIAAGSDETLYVVDATGVASRIDARTGAAVGRSPAGGYAGIVAVIPHQ